MPLALVRAPSPRLGDCELTHLERAPIDVAIAASQHLAYCTALRRCSCTVQELPALPEHPDGVFVEDAAVVLDEVAVIARPGAASRRREVDSVQVVLREHRALVHIDPPATLDGGDVLRVGRDVLAGLSARTDRAAVEQLMEKLTPYGYRVHAIGVTGGLHLKSACTAVANDLLMINRAWIDQTALRRALPSVEMVDVDPAEPRGANHLMIGSSVISPASCPRTVNRICGTGIHPAVVDVSELEKAEAGVTCSSLIVTP